MADRPGFVYVIEMDGQGVYKIGRARDVKKRLGQYKPLPPFPYRLCFANKFPNPEYVETGFHRMLERERLSGEWFKLTPLKLEIIRLSFIYLQAGFLLDHIEVLIERHSLNIEMQARLARLLERGTRRHVRRRRAMDGVIDTWRTPLVTEVPQ